MVPMIHVTDHLGSVRAVVEGISGEVVETNDYYPFGGRWDVAAGLKDDTNRFRYNSKEEQFNFGTPYIDYGARQYDPVLGRWFAQDPLAEKYYGISPYAFCAGNPVKYLDPDGRKLYFADDTSSEFKQKFLEAVLFMNSKGTSGHIAALHESDVVYYITNLPKESEEIGKNMSKFDWQNTTIYWDYTHFALTSRNIYLSPATVLAHEVAHAVRYDEAIKSGTKSRWISEIQSGTDNQYGSIEERAVITTTEQIVALKHGEIDSEQVTRTDHNGKLCYETVADSSPEDISKTAYERNIIWK